MGEAEEYTKVIDYVLKALKSLYRTKKKPIRISSESVSFYVLICILIDKSLKYRQEHYLDIKGC